MVLASVCAALLSACPDVHGTAADGGVDSGVPDWLAAKFERAVGASVEGRRLWCVCDGINQECTGGEDPRKQPAWARCLLDVSARDPEMFSDYYDCAIEVYEAQVACLERCATDGTRPCDSNVPFDEQCPQLSKELDDAVVACKKNFDRPTFK